MHDASYFCDPVRGDDGRLSGLRIIESWARSDAFPRTKLPDSDAASAELLDAIDRALDAGTPADHERHDTATGRWDCIHIVPLSGRVSLLYEDISERRADRERLHANAEAQAFLLSLSDALRPLADAEAIQLTAARHLADRLQAERVGYAEDCGDGETVSVRLHHAAGLPPLSGVYRYADFGQERRDAFHAGRTVVCGDVASDPSLSAEVRAAHEQIGVSAMVDVPLVKAGQLLAVFFVHRAEPHAWTPEEVTLVEAVAERTWSAIERARAEAARRTSDERYRLLFDSIDEGFCVIEMLFADGAPTDYRILEVNRAFAAQTGLTDAVGRRMRELAPQHEQHWFDVYGRIALTGVPERFVNEAQHVGGRWYDVYAFRIDEPQLHRVAVLFKDISEQRRTEAALLETDRRKDEFLAVLAHELRNPLAPVRTGLEVLKRHAGDAFVTEKTRAMMERQVGHMVRLIDDLMDVSRIARGKLHLHRQRTTVNDALRSALETTAPLLDASHHQLQARIPEEPLPVDGDPVRLAQVFGNLLNNAIRYTPAGGRIHVEARAKGDSVRVDIEDTGIGIAPELLELVFEPFAQFSGADAAQGGLGVGLALAKSLVELHGGTVVAHSEGLGLGSRFTVSLPRAEADVARVGGQAAPPAVRSRRVLVVDDNRDAAEALSLLLGLLGHVVHLAHDGLAALEAADTHRPEVVLLDLGLPGIDGYEVARRLRANPELRDALIVALSGYGQQADRQRSKEAGFDHHLVKPADVDVLSTVLASKEAAEL